MRPGQNKRMRGRPNSNNNSTGGGGNRKGPNPLTRSYESNGPDVKIRGNAHHVAEKYLQLARDAQSSGDPVAAESYLQHAEHYFRLIASAQAAQAGYSRQPDAVDTEGQDEDESGIPDRFASPVAAVPFVPQPVAQPYAAERQPYNGERPAYQDRQNGGERPAYQDRQATGERQPYGDRNNFERPQRQDRNGINRRPYRDNVAGGDMRPDDRQSQDRQGQDRQSQGQDRPTQDRQGQDRPYQDRPFQDRQTRRERFAQERNGQDRGYDRQDRQQGGDRDGASEVPRDPYAGEQPRVEAAERPAERQPDLGFRSSPDPTPSTEMPRTDTPRTEMPRTETGRTDAAPQVETASEPVMRAAPRRQPRAERVAAAPLSDDAPGLPSFITTPTRVTAAEPSLATETSFPGDGADDAPKFPRRRRRTTRTTAEGDAGTDLPVSGD